MKIYPQTIIVLLIFLFLCISCSKYIVPGKYRTNFPTYGMFGKTLTINCDSSIIMNFAGDLMNDNSFGSWKVINDTLVIVFDTINYPNSRYKDDLHYRIKGNRLYNIPFTRTEYFELVQKIRDSSNYTIKIPSFRKFNRNLDKNMTNHKGRMKRQYFKKIEKFECINK